MTPRKAGVLMALAVLLIGVAVFAFIFTTRPSDFAPPDASAQPQVPTQRPTEPPVFQQPVDAGEGPIDDGPDTLLDFTTQNAAAAAGVTQFLTYDTGEDGEARLARLATDFTDPAAAAAMTPAMLPEDRAGFASYSAVLTVNSIDGVAWLSQASETSDTLLVFVSYTLIESMPGQEQVTRDRGEWRVTIDRTDPTRILALKQ